MPVKIHPTTPGTLIGHGRRGPIYLIGGGAEEGATGGEPAPPAETTPAEKQTEPAPPKPAEPAPSEDLTKLREALEKERTLRKDADKRAKEGEGYRAKVEEIEAASKTEIEKAVDAARKEGAAEALGAANARLVSSEARALAAQAKFRDAGDAVRFLELGDVKVADDGTVDTTAISKQLEQLGKDKPYLLVDEKPALPTPAQAGIGVGSGNSDASVTPGMGRLRHAYRTK